MGWVLPEIVIQKIISNGLSALRKDRAEFDDIFCQLVSSDLEKDYGNKYLDEMWKWFSTTKLPVVKAWNFNVQSIPSISIQLASETEDENKAAVGDYAGTFDDDFESNVGVFTVMIDIGIHTNKTGGDQVIWLYYIISYLLFKYKNTAHALGLRLHTFSASDYNKDASKMTENVWTRWIRFRCTTQNFINSDRLTELDGINFDPKSNLEPASDISVSLDVTSEDYSNTANAGIIFQQVIDEDEL